LDDWAGGDGVSFGKSADFYDGIRRVAGAYERARKRRSDGNPHVEFPSVPEIVVMAHQVKLELTPLEYLATPADLFFELTMAKALWTEGVNGAREGPREGTG
jgi:hypothetical protein